MKFASFLKYFFSRFIWFHNVVGLLKYADEESNVEIRSMEINYTNFFGAKDDRSSFAIFCCHVRNNKLIIILLLSLIII